MNRKKFLRKGAWGLSSIFAIPSVLATGCEEGNVDPSSCNVMPSETAGPFTIKSPADWVRENIIGDRAGIPLMMTFIVQNTNSDCSPLADVYVDIWHCDANGNYSEYDGQLDGNFTSEHFLRGRQKTAADGTVSFISIYPGWYPGRAPHIHIEILDSNENSLLVSQVAFPENISNEVYATSDYSGAFDTSNNRDGSFRDSLSRNIVDTIGGNITDGYTLSKIIKVAG
ncbi:MAG: intradiol ring-cleavage dioxygenase [Bacteroidota bacterium]